MPGSCTIINATVVLADHVQAGATVRCRDGLITDVIPGLPAALPPSDPDIIDAAGAYLIPGVVDLHNDNLEFEINPRAGANLPLPFALATMERRLAASGVTTEFHAVSFHDMTRKGRTIADAGVKAAYLADRNDSPDGGVRHHILHRLDVRTPESLDAARPTLSRVRVPYVSLNDHTPGQGQYRDVERLIAISQADHGAGRGHAASPEWYHERMRAALADVETVPRFYRDIAALAAELPLVISTHDDDTVEKVDEQIILGAQVAEFPVTISAAERARQHGMAIIVGAPNIVRGGSQSGNLAATELIDRDLADVICADYHAPSLIPAAFRLVRDGHRDLPAAITMITRAPALSVGLTDRGLIAPGLVADLALVRLDGDGLPHVEMTIVDGAVAFSYRRRAAEGETTAAAAGPSTVAIDVSA